MPSAAHRTRSLTLEWSAYSGVSGARVVFVSLGRRRRTITLLLSASIALSAVAQTDRRCQRFAAQPHAFLRGAPLRSGTTSPSAGANRGTSWRVCLLNSIPSSPVMRSVRASSPQLRTPVQALFCPPPALRRQAAGRAPHPGSATTKSLARRDDLHPSTRSQGAPV
jgi:hypothetical protein